MARLIDESITAQVTGTVDQAGNVTFTYEVTEIGNPNGIWRVVYQGQGKFSSNTQAGARPTLPSLAGRTTKVIYGVWAAAQAHQVRQTSQVQSRGVLLFHCSL